MGSFDGRKNPCRFCMVYSQTPLYGFFRRAKKTMQISHGLLSNTFVWVFSTGEKNHADFAWFIAIHPCMVFFIGRKNPCRFRMVYCHTPLYVFLPGKKKHADFAWFIAIHPCMGFFVGRKNPCRFRMVYCHTPLYVFFCPAKKTMQILHGL
jgi:hypothetical protein